ncbi:hypothetical protein A6410_19860 [Prescottella equi]|uniref:Uncharacterized protein n=2 Tax=Rhodococcus hoagii TaxID=43767 RepID=A0AAE5MHC1_RHOHA|nr:hypothetical protein A6410_19860 [Prescottella equi]ORL25352.1 hypothetical protein A6I89_19785 [Prescottella equi]ORL97979.1 hypothetical protein A5N73_20315 [Prescottella equi]ORM22484.1 hypothetical protein A5N68_20610 [Prescottella equi]BDC70401.1 hypothetical protein KAREA_03160 [Prescottella equi]
MGTLRVPLEAELMRQVRQKSLDTGIPVNAYIEAALRAWVEDAEIGTVKPGRRRDLGPGGKARAKA